MEKQGMTTESTDGQAANTTEGQATSTAAETATEQTTQDTSGTTAQPQATEAKEGDTKQGDTTSQVPEKYEFTMPDGVQMDEAGVKAFSEFAKKQGLSQDVAQALLSEMAPAMASRQAEQLEQLKTDWANQTKADEEIGGDKLDENLATAKKARDAFFTPEFNTWLEETGLGSHPEMIRGLYRAGKAISEDGFVSGKQADKPKTNLYPNSNMNP